MCSELKVFTNKINHVLEKKEKNNHTFFRCNISALVERQAGTLPGQLLELKILSWGKIQRL